MFGVYIAESYAQGLLVLEQCLSTQLGEGKDPPDENSRGMVLLAMSSMLSERLLLLLLLFCIHLIFMLFQTPFWSSISV